LEENSLGDRKKFMQYVGGLLAALPDHHLPQASEQLVRHQQAYRASIVLVPK
jgi:hypothetical protein